MNKKSFALLCAVVALPAALAGQGKGGQDETGPYDVVENWLQPVHPGWYHHVTGVYAESPNRIFITASGETPIAEVKPGQRAPNAPAGFDPARPGAKSDHFLIVVDGNGRIIEEWKQLTSLLVRPHTVQMSPYDREKHVWIVDREGQQIVKFTNDGKTVVLTIGEKGVPGTDEKHFNRPADLAFLPDGSMLVADGYVNARVIKFDKDGRYLQQWGSKGTGPGQFNLVHCVAVDANGRVYVADRSNGRVQVFDANGKYIEEWKSRRPTHFLITQDQSIWLSDGETNRFLKYDLAGKLLTYWGVSGTFPGAIDNPHKFSVDSAGNLYVVDYNNNRLQKYIPRPGGDRRRLIGPQYKAAGGQS
jgi:DNA-binding beta-propeller fold protein YncE